MQDSSDTARRIDSLKSALAGHPLPGQAPLRAQDLGEVFMNAGASPEQLAGPGAARYAAAADLLARQKAEGTKPCRLAHALRQLGYTEERVERLVMLRGETLRNGIVELYRKARMAGMSPDPYLACCLLLEDGVREGVAAEMRRKIIKDYRALA